MVEEGNPAATRRFRDVLAQPGVIVQPTVTDPLAAQIAERVRSKALALGGYALGAQLAISERYFL